MLRVILAVLAVAAAWAGGFEDPAPPKTAERKAGPPPEPRENPTIRLHGPPKPLAKGAVSEDWPSFRGPRHDMTSRETGLALKSPPAGPKLVWEMQKGPGYSSPAIHGERLVFTHRVEDEETVECLHPEDGRLYWRFSYPTSYRDRYGYNGGPRASPVIDEGRVYVYGALGQLHSLDLETGQLLWKRDLAKEFRVPQDFFGTSATPVIEGDLLIVNLGAPGGPTVAAFDKLTGRLRWGAGDEWGPSYSTPTPATVHGKRRLFVFAGGESRPPTGGLLSIDPSDGKVDFAFPWRSRSYESVNAASPTVAGNRVLISASYRTGAAMLEIGRDFKVAAAWTSDDFDLHFGTAIHRDGYLYGFPGRNEPDASLMCVDARTGKTVWKEVLEWQETVDVRGQRRQIYSSPYRGALLEVEGKFLALGELGHLLWLDLSPEGPKILARSQPFLARESWSPPVISRGLLYLCQNTASFDGKPPRLLCYDLRR